MPLPSPFLPLVALGLGLAAALAAPLSATAQEGDGTRPSNAVLEKQFADGVKAYDAERYGRAFELWLPLAQNGDLAAQRNVAHMLRRGLGVEKDAARARFFYRQSAEYGFVTAQTDLAMMLLAGEGGDKDEEEAAYWLDLAARGGHPLAQFHLAQLYETGLVEAPNPGRALGWYALSARAGYQPALDRLAELVMTLPGPSSEGHPDKITPPPDEKTEPPEAPAGAADTEERAEDTEASATPADDTSNADDAAETAAGTEATADAPAPEASAEAAPKTMALSFPEAVSGLPDGKDAYARREYRAALAQFEARAYRGDADAQYMLGRMRNRGEGEPRDPVAALAWWQLAAGQGHAEAQKAASSLSGELGPRRRGEAEREAAQFQALIDQMPK
ncbi:tetratricopeptide repeat protein [Pyruvatibacter mobilis]|uniref:tetratricopeptide repeat protein n=1 Tax=Pyruvatibacter mobilis TaxID=1712261 RepID=UPI003BA85CC2